MRTELFLPALTLLAAPVLAQDAPQDERPWGHSTHGAAFDAGPRQRPWIMEGIGSTPFPITTSNPEVQQWFDQAIVLLHGFWYYEAERSLRWCLKLDPECTMAYWALSIAVDRDDERAAEFLDMALARKDQVTERERGFLEVTEAFRKAQAAEEAEQDEALAAAVRRFDQLLMDYPEDVEAKALYWLILGKSAREQSELMRYGMESVLDDVLELDPDHVGAHHYRVHNWDGKEGRYAIDSCMVLDDLAPRCGHLLHMPGHVLSGIGLWHEAAIAMDQATRVEKTYMNERMIVPENNWDYMHNLDYLCYIQEQLGMQEAALFGADQLLLAPAMVDMPPFFDMFLKNPMHRALVKFERWEEILEGDRLPWDPTSPIENSSLTYARARALIGLGRLEEAEEEVAGLRPEKEKRRRGPGAPPGAPDGDAPASPPAEFLAMHNAGMLAELEALLLLARGEHLAGLSLLTEAAEKQEENWQNDPPQATRFLFNALGDAYLEIGAPRLAVDCYERTLETVFHDGFALAGLVVAHHQLGEGEAAREAMAKLQVVWSDADPNRWLTAALATGVQAEPYLDAPVEQRNYRREVLDVQGPSAYVPTAAPALHATNAKGERVALADYAGQNVLLIFYLGEECLHCIEQLTTAQERIDSLRELDTVVLAVSKDEVDTIAAQVEDFDLVLLSDTEFENARRFQSYDDFEEIELHSTFLIDREGRVHWSRIGGEPFTNFDYLERELARMNGAVGHPVAATLPGPPGAGSE